MRLAVDIKEILKTFPLEERYALTDQLRRASTSILFNIAEAFGRYTNKDRVRFLDIANGSAMEVSSELELAKNFGYISSDILEKFDNDIVVIIRRLARLRYKLLNQE